MHRSLNRQFGVQLVVTRWVLLWFSRWIFLEKLEFNGNYRFARKTTSQSDHSLNVELMARFRRRNGIWWIDRSSGLVCLLKQRCSKNQSCVLSQIHKAFRPTKTDLLAKRYELWANILDMHLFTSRWPRSQTQPPFTSNTVASIRFNNNLISETGQRGPS